MECGSKPRLHMDLTYMPPTQENSATPRLCEVCRLTKCEVHGILLVLCIAVTASLAILNELYLSFQLLAPATLTTVTTTFPTLLTCLPTAISNE